MALRLLYASFDAVPAPKGASTHILETVTGLASRLGPVTLVCAGLPGQSDEDDLAPGVTVRRSPPGGANFLDRVESHRRFLARVLERETFDHVQFRDVWSAPPVLERATGRGWRTVFEVNGLPSFELAYHYPGLAGRRDFVRRLRTQELACMLGADRIMTPSAVTRDYIVRLGLAPARVTVVPNGVDAAAFAPPDAEPPAATPRLAYVGTLAPWQGVDTLLDALRKVVRVRPAELVLAGHGRKAWTRHILTTADDLGVGAHVRLLGPLPPEDVAGFIRSASLCLAPLERTRRNTRQGCCPLKLLEYMACARPFVASDLPVVRALVPSWAEDFLVPPGKSGDLARRILAILDDPSRALDVARRLRAHVVEGFTWDRNADAVAGLHRSLARGGRITEGNEP